MAIEGSHGAGASPEICNENVKRDLASSHAIIRSIYRLCRYLSMLGLLDSTSIDRREHSRCCNAVESPTIHMVTFVRSLIGSAALINNYAARRIARDVICLGGLILEIPPRLRSVGWYIRLAAMCSVLIAESFILRGCMFLVYTVRRVAANSITRISADPALCLEQIYTCRGLGVTAPLTDRLLGTEIRRPNSQ